MKRKKLENIWVWFVIIAITLVSIIGVVNMFSENPIKNIRYIFAFALITIPINLIMSFFCSRAKD